MARALAAVAVLGACGGESVPAPCRAPLVATLDGAPLAFDRIFGYRTGAATGVAWFSGVDLTLRLADGQGGAHALRMVGRFDAEDCGRR